MIPLFMTMIDVLRNGLRQGPAADLRGFSSEPTMLGICEAQISAIEVFAKNSVLVLETLDHVSLVAVDPSGDEQDGELKGCRHPMSVLDRIC